MQDFYRLISKSYQGYYDANPTENVTPLEELFPKVELWLKDKDLAIEAHDFKCSGFGDACNEVCCFWSVLNDGNVRIDLLQRLIETKHIDLEDENFQRRILNAFYHALSNAGYNPGTPMPGNIRIMIDFFFDLVESNEGLIERARTFKVDDYEASLFHAPFYNCDMETRPIYIDRLIKMGVNLMFTKPGQQERNEALILMLDRTLVGQSPLYLAALDSVEMLKKFVSLPGFNQHLLSYDVESLGDLENRSYAYMPFLMCILFRMREWKEVKSMREVCESLKFLLSLNLIDINIPVLYSTGKKHNITDFFHYYEFLYEGSPYSELFSLVTLPPPIDPLFENFDPKERCLWRSRRREMSPYEILFAKYKYTKDPTKFPLIRQELEALTEVGIQFTEEDTTSDWRYVPIVEEFLDRELVVFKRNQSLSFQTDNFTRLAEDDHLNE